MHTPLESTDFSAKILKKVRYTHDAMIDQIIGNPGISEKELAQVFGYSVQWVNRLLCSDAFQARLALRKEEVIDPKLTATVEERLRGLAMQSLEVIQEKLAATKDAKVALKALELCTKAQGYGAGQKGPVSVNFVVALPTVAPTEKAWEDRYAGSQGKSITFEGKAETIQGAE